MFSSLKVSTRFLLLTLVLASIGISLLLASALFGMHRIQSAAAAAMANVERMDTTQEMARTVQLHFGAQLQEWKNLLLRGVRGGDEAALRQALEQFSAEEQGVQATLREMLLAIKGMGADDFGLDQTIKSHANLGEKYRLALGNYQTSGVFEVDNQVKDLDRQVSEGIERVAKRLVALQRKAKASEIESFANMYETQKRWMLLFGAVILIAVLPATWWVTLTITKPISKIVGATENLRAGEGDLTFRLPALGGEFDHIATSLNGFVTKIQNMLLKIRSSTEAVSRSAHEIGAGGIDLSTRAEQQAATLEETVSTMEELTATVNESAGSFDKANQFARQASRVAEDGGQIISQVKQKMTEIDTSAKRIADITGAIDGIAFQTNILALNAAVEAARAGEQGRGFGVVAAEVRQLAQRSATAAKEIKNLIVESTAKAEEGNRLVTQAERTMLDIVAATGEVSRIMSNVSATALEQSRGIEQINEALTQMNTTVQQNAAVVEEAAAAAESQKLQTQQLLAEVQVFKLEATQAAKNASVPESSVTPRAQPRASALRAKDTRPRPILTPAPETTDDWREF